MIIYSYSEYQEKLVGIEINTTDINKGNDFFAVSLETFNFYPNTIQMIETDTSLIFINLGDPKEKEYTLEIKDVDILKDTKWQGSWGTVLEEVEIKKFSTKFPEIKVISKNDLLELNYENIKNRFNQISNENIKKVILNKLEKEQKEIFDFEERKYLSKFILPFADGCIWLKKGCFNIYNFNLEDNVLFYLNDLGYTESSIVITGIDLPLYKASEFIVLSNSNNESLENIPLKELGYLEISIRKFNDDNYLGYRNDKNAQNSDFISFYSRKDGHSFENTYEQIKVEENSDYIEVFEKDRYEENSWNTVFKMRLNSEGDDLTLKNKTFEYNCKIKEKIIDDWNSYIYDIVYLENGQLWLYEKDYNEIISEILLEENCKSFNFLRDYNNECTIIKTNTHIYYWPRTDFNIDNNIDKSQYIYKEELTDELKNNTYYKVPYTKKYSKPNKLWTLTYTEPVQVEIIDNKTILKNMTDEYFLYSPVEGMAKLTLNNKLYLFMLDQEYKNARHYTGGDLFNTQKVKRWPGMHTMVIKDSLESNNYILVKSKNKKKVFIFLKQENETYKEETNIDFYDNNEYCGEGTKIFNDKVLPDELYIDGSSYRHSLRAIYFYDNDEYEEIITSYDPYEKQKIKKGKK